MGDFLTAALAFPAAVFGFALLVVIGYWLLVLCGGVDADSGGHHGGADGHDGTDHPGAAGLLAAAGLGGVPASVAVSLLIALAWFLSLAGTALLQTSGLSGRAQLLAGAAVLLGAVCGSWAGTRLLVRPLGRLFPEERPPSRLDFVGRVCVIRTGRVDGGFGQAEVAAEDGSTAIVQVRTDDSGLASGSTALIFDYVPEGEFFLVTPFDAALDPGSPAV
ncbi:hypothetical protein [Streptomyces sp. NPDC002537]